MQQPCNSYCVLHIFFYGPNAFIIHKTPPCHSPVNWSSTLICAFIGSAKQPEQASNRGQIVITFQSLPSQMSFTSTDAHSLWKPMNMKWLWNCCCSAVKCSAQLRRVMIARSALVTVHWTLFSCPQSTLYSRHTVVGRMIPTDALSRVRSTDAF